MEMDSRWRKRVKWKSRGVGGKVSPYAESLGYKKSHGAWSTRPSRNWDMKSGFVVRASVACAISYNTSRCTRARRYSSGQSFHWGESKARRTVPRAFCSLALDDLHRWTLDLTCTRIFADRSSRFFPSFLLSLQASAFSASLIARTQRRKTNEAFWKALLAERETTR